MLQEWRVNIYRVNIYPCRVVSEFCVSACPCHVVAAQVGGPKLGPSQKFGTQKIQKIKILKIKIRVAQNVGKVWISRKKSSWPHLGPSGPIFCVGRKNAKNRQFLPIFCYSPGLGPLLLSTLGGAIGKKTAYCDPMKLPAFATH